MHLFLLHTLAARSWTHLPLPHLLPLHENVSMRIGPMASAGYHGLATLFMVFHNAGGNAASTESRRWKIAVCKPVSYQTEGSA
jgi:hypothetical protein